jgi:hypothetical protein
MGPGAPMGPGGPGWTPGVAGPKKKKRWPWVLLAIFVLLVALIGGCTALVVKAVGKPVKAGNNFADALYKSPADAAAMLCPGTALNEEGLKTQRDALIAAGWTGSKSLLGANVSSSNGSSSAIVSGTFGSSAVTIEMGKNGSDYCVNELISPGSFSPGTVPDISIPDFSIPDISIPDVSIPDISIPDISIPTIGDITVPDFTLPPDVSIPDVADITLPAAPGDSVPVVVFGS